MNLARCTTAAFKDQNFSDFAQEGQGQDAEFAVWGMAKMEKVGKVEIGSCTDFRLVL
jgi:hypothetical protein